jgi:hypothetical protein
MRLISEDNKMDIGFKSASLNGTSNGKFYAMSNYRHALFIATIGAMAEGETAIIQVLQALDAEGTDSKDITDAIATVTANVNAAVLKLSIVTAVGGIHVAGQTVTVSVDGENYVFTAAAADVVESRVYAVGADGGESAANLLAKINSSNNAIRVPKVIGVASVDGADSIITLKAEETGEAVISAVASAATTVISTIEAISYVEIDGSAMDVNNEFSHVAIKVTTTAATLAVVSLLRGEPRYTPKQEVAASAVVLS